MEFRVAGGCRFQTGNLEVTPEEYYIKMEILSSWNLGNVTVKPIEWGLDLGKKQFLVGEEQVISDEQTKNRNLTLIIDKPCTDGVIAFRIVETNPD